MWTEFPPEVGLAAAIIKRAVDDLEIGSPHRAISALRFFCGSWYVTLCSFLEIEPRWRPGETMKENDRFNRALDVLRQGELNAALRQIISHLPTSELDSSAPFVMIEMGEPPLPVLAAFRESCDDAYFSQSGQTIRLRRSNEEISIVAFQNGREVAVPAVGAN